MLLNPTNLFSPEGNGENNVSLRGLLQSLLKGMECVEISYETAITETKHVSFLPTFSNKDLN